MEMSNLRPLDIGEDRSEAAVGGQPDEKRLASRIGSGVRCSSCASARRRRVLPPAVPL